MIMNEKGLNYQILLKTQSFSIVYNLNGREYDYQAKKDNDDPVENLKKAMMLLARAFTQQYSIPTNNRLGTSSNTRNQTYVQGGRIDVHGKSIGYARDTGRNVGSSRNASRSVGYAVANTTRVVGNSGSTSRVAGNV
ncbi:hypothetical protein Tco_0318337 [Tanacetum coccineum]